MVQLIDHYLVYLPLIIGLATLVVSAKFIGKALSDNGNPSSTRILWFLIGLVFCKLCFYDFATVQQSVLWVMCVVLFILGGFAKIQDIKDIISGFNQMKNNNNGN